MRSRRYLAVLAAIAIAIATTVPALATNDELRTRQWNVDRVEAPMAWELSRGAGIVIAIVDTGVDLEHPDLVDRFARRPDGSVLGRDYVDDDDDVPDDENGHGTLVAGVAAATADNVEGIAGIAPEALLMPIRVLDEDGGGDGADVDRAIRWAVDNGAHVINLSLESVGDSPAVQLPITAPTSAVRYAWTNGVIVVAAAGNDSSRADDYPPDSPVVLVGATTREDRRASFSDAGRSDALMAPGVEITSTWWCDPEASGNCPEEHGYGEADGTSFAAPHVSGAAAVLRSLGFDHEQTVERLRETARDMGAPGPDEDTGHGLIDIAAAAGARNPPSSPSPTSSPRPSASPTGPASPSPSPSASSSPSPSPSPAPAPSPSPSPSASPTLSDEPDPSTTVGGRSPQPPPSDSPTPGTGGSPAAAPSPDDAAAPPTRNGDGGHGPTRAAATGLLGAAIAAHVLVRRRLA